MPTDNSTASQASNVNINGTTYMTAYKQPDGTFHYINQNIVSDTELQPFNINTIGGSAEATTNVALGANLPSGDPTSNPNDTPAGGVHEVRGHVPSPAIRRTRCSPSPSRPPTLVAGRDLSAAPRWPPLYNNSSATAGPLVYSSSGQLEFNSSGRPL